MNFFKLELFKIFVYIMIETIYMLWLQGFDNAPDIVKRCVQSWKYYNPNWNIVLLDNNNYKNYVNLDNSITNKSIAKCHLADIIRVQLINLYGGVWADATTFCNKPLNEWLPNYITEGFFAFDKPGPDRLISNWFLYSEKNNYIANEWCNKILDYHNKNSTATPYFIHHYLFGDLYNQDPIFTIMWDKVPKLSANGNGPHYLQEKGLLRNVSIQNKLDIDNKITPLYKLTYKFDFLGYNESCNLHYLLSTVNS